jgi:predicted O-methyltransferase YrrM
MSKFLQTALGLNLAAIWRGLRFGPHNFGYTCRESCRLVRPFESPDDKWLREAFDAIPVMTLESIVGGRCPLVRLQVTSHEDGRLPLADALGLLSILIAEQPKVVLEIGTFMGHATRAMAENLEQAVIHTVDLPPDFSPREAARSPLPKDDFHLIQRRIVGREFRSQACEKRIVQHFGDTAELDFKQFGQPEFFFIDGSHTYEYCKNDSEKCLALCPRGGTFLWHDCELTHPGVVRLVAEWRRAGRNLVRVQGTALAYWKNI